MALVAVVAEGHAGRWGCKAEASTEQSDCPPFRLSVSYATQLVWLIACPPENASIVVTLPLVRMIT